MHILAFISQKGGVGKTTLAIHLAVAFTAGGYNAALLDLDPQASAAEWKDARTDHTPPVIAVPAARLEKVIEETKAAKTDVLLIDTAPHSESTALTAARVADLILVPCQPSIMDLRVQYYGRGLGRQGGSADDELISPRSQCCHACVGIENVNLGI
jgi:chromosome partitioning protein